MTYRDPLGVNCPDHGFQDGRTICRFCSYGKDVRDINRRGVGPVQIPKIGFDRRARSSLKGADVLPGTLSLSDPAIFSHKLPDDQLQEFINAMP